MDALKAHDPARIGAHTLLARLGAGGMGQVYLGRSPGGRLVALKVIRDEITDHPEALARFRREVETVRAVRSAYTANLIDASLETAPYWLATEYVPGPTLSKAVAARGPMPAETCRALLAALAEGLAAVHAHDVTHRDLKPQNVILAAQGPQLIDFGIARSAAQTALTEAGFAPGTPGYTAPEVLLRNEVGPAADVFALGATLAHAATGRSPFGYGEPTGVNYRAVHEAIDLGGVEPDLAALVESCVAKDPAARPGLAEVIARCGVRTALIEDAFYGGLAGLAETPPPSLVPAEPSPAAAAASSVTPPGSAAPAPPAHPPFGTHDLPTATSPNGNGHGYTPTQLPPTTPPSPAGRPRPKAWLFAGAAGLAVGVSVAAALTFLPGGNDDTGRDKLGAAGPGTTSASARTSVPASATTATPGITTTPSATEDDGPALQPPAYVEQTNPSRDFWTTDESAWGGGQCNLPAEERSDQFQSSISAADSDDPYTSGKGRIGIRLKYESEEPYYVSVAVKSPHEIDADTGRPIEGSPAQNLGLGYTSKPVAIGTDWTYLTYPDDFQQNVLGKKYSDAIPVENDPGDWTVLFLHVRGAKEYASIDCRGFLSK
ncbi:serine/threonine-protein kinase [Streptomyces sp. NPDC017936]|uniref:serine/threonine-protein kinase n=1 Tax=Streptomyces sp. NPDC017936 TaxID=3365016 RepID=UPI0037A50339